MNRFPRFNAAFDKAAAITTKIGTGITAVFKGIAALIALIVGGYFVFKFGWKFILLVIWVLELPERYPH